MDKLSFYYRTSSFRRLLLNQSRVRILFSKPACLSKSYTSLVKPWNQYQLFTRFPSLELSQSCLTLPNTRKFFAKHILTRNLFTRSFLLTPNKGRSQVITSLYSRSFLTNISKVQSKKHALSKIHSAMELVKQHLRKSQGCLSNKNVCWSGIHNQFFDQKYPNLHLKSCLLIKNPRISSTLTVGLAFLKQNHANFLASRNGNSQNMQVRTISTRKSPPTVSGNFSKEQPKTNLTSGKTSSCVAIRKISLDQSQQSLICWPKPDYGPMEVFRSEFMNGIRVAAAKPMGGQISACTIMFRSGSRSEVDDELGATHFVRAASGLSGCAYSGFIKTRFLQQHGGYISCASDRQTVSFTLRCPLPFFCDLKYYLLDAAVRCKYYQHDLEKVKPIIKRSLSRLPMEEHCLDLIQKACWAGPLYNSIYCCEERIEDMSEQTLRCFATRNFSTSRCSVGSCGVPFEEALKVAEFVDCGITKRPEEICEAPSWPRAGYEEYYYGPGDTYVCLAVPTCGCTRDLGQLYRYAILAETLGATNIHQSEHVWDFVPSPPLGNLSGCTASTFRAFHIAYVDMGMFGIMLKTSSQEARAATCRLADFFTRIANVTKEQIDIGKRRLKLALCVHDDGCVRVSEGLALQVANCHVFNNARTSMEHIDCICPEDIMAAARQLDCSRGQMAMAVVGDLDAVPDDKELNIRS